MQATSETAGRPVLTLNTQKLNELRRANGIRSEADLARKLGVNTSTLYRVTSGTTVPSNAFIAGLKRAFPLCSLDDLLLLAVAA